MQRSLTHCGSWTNFYRRGCKMSKDTEYTDNPVCPYCGHTEQDAWEIDFGPGLDGDTETSCGNCGKDYKVFRNTTVYYSTYKCGKEKK